MPNSLVGTNVLSYETDPLGLILKGTITGAGSTIPTTASTFSVGCEITNIGDGTEYTNTGTVAVPVWTSNPANKDVGQVITVSLTAAQIIDTAAGSLSHANGLIVVPAAPV